VRFVRQIWIEYDLRYPVSVSQIDEDYRPVIPSIGNPSKKNYLAVNIRRAQCATIMGALELIDKSSQGTVLSEARQCRARLLARRW
jgi:hypothetical protein